MVDHAQVGALSESLRGWFRNDGILSESEWEAAKKMTGSKTSPELVAAVETVLEELFTGQLRGDSSCYTMPSRVRDELNKCLGNSTTPMLGRRVLSYRHDLHCLRHPFYREQAMAGVKRVSDAIETYKTAIASYNTALANWRNDREKQEDILIPLEIPLEIAEETLLTQRKALQELRGELDALRADTEQVAIYPELISQEETVGANLDAVLSENQDPTPTSQLIAEWKVERLYDSAEQLSPDVRGIREPGMETLESSPAHWKQPLRAHYFFKGYDPEFITSLLTTSATCHTIMENGSTPHPTPENAIIFPEHILMIGHPAFHRGTHPLQFTSDYLNLEFTVEPFGKDSAHVTLIFSLSPEAVKIIEEKDKKAGGGFITLSFSDKIDLSVRYIVRHWPGIIRRGLEYTAQQVGRGRRMIEDSAYRKKISDKFDQIALERIPVEETRSQHEDAATAMSVIGGSLLVAAVGVMIASSEFEDPLLSRDLAFGFAGGCMGALGILLTVTLTKPNLPGKETLDEIEKIRKWEDFLRHEGLPASPPSQSLLMGIGGQF